MTNEEKVASEEGSSKQDSGKIEHPLFELIKTSTPETVVDNVRNYFEIDGISIEIMDSSGMTPLMHACWKGNIAFAKFLIGQVNIKQPISLELCTVKEKMMIHI